MIGPSNQINYPATCPIVFFHFLFELFLLVDNIIIIGEILDADENILSPPAQPNKCVYSEISFLKQNKTKHTISAHSSCSYRIQESKTKTTTTTTKGFAICPVFGGGRGVYMTGIRKFWLHTHTDTTIQQW